MGALVSHSFECSLVDLLRQGLIPRAEYTFLKPEIDSFGEDKT